MHLIAFDKLTKEIDIVQYIHSMRMTEFVAKMQLDPFQLHAIKYFKQFNVTELEEGQRYVHG